MSSSRSPWLWQLHSTTVLDLGRRRWSCSRTPPYGDRGPLGPEAWHPLAPSWVPCWSWVGGSGSSSARLVPCARHCRGDPGCFVYVCFETRRASCWTLCSCVRSTCPLCSWRSRPLVHVCFETHDGGEDVEAQREGPPRHAAHCGGVGGMAALDHGRAPSTALLVVFREEEEEEKEEEANDPEDSVWVSVQLLFMTLLLVLFACGNLDMISLAPRCAHAVFVCCLRRTILDSSGRRLSVMFPYLCSTVDTCALRVCDA